MEDYVDIKSTEEPEWEMDEWMTEHLDELGLGDNEQDDSGNEFISYK